MNWLQSIIYGIISGLTEFLPLSSYGHQQIFMHLCGQESRDPALDMFVHIAQFIAIWSFCRPSLEQISRDRRVSRRTATRNTKLLLDHNVVKRAALPLLIFYFALRYIFSGFNGTLAVCIGLLVNGIILFLPTRMLAGNRDARTMTPIDNILLGISGSVSAIAGLSRIGCTVSFASVRGIDRKNALQWALLLSMHALGACIVVDLISLFAGSGVSSWMYLINYFLAGIASYFCARTSIHLVRFLIMKDNQSTFSFYCWGASLFAFVLYLTVT